MPSNTHDSACLDHVDMAESCSAIAFYLRGKMLYTHRRPAHSAARFGKRAIVVKPGNRNATDNQTFGYNPPL